jgi:hypothetical protein
MNKEYVVISGQTVIYVLNGLFKFKTEQRLTGLLLKTLNRQYQGLICNK